MSRIRIVKSHGEIPSFVKDVIFSRALEFFRWVWANDSEVLNVSKKPSRFNVIWYWKYADITFDKFREMMNNVDRDIDVM